MTVNSTSLEPVTLESTLREKSKPSPTWVELSTNREQQTQKRKQGSSRRVHHAQEHHSRSPPGLNSASSIQTSSLFSCMEQKATKQRRDHYPKKTDIHQQLSAQDPGLTLSVTKTCGRKPTSEQPKKKSEEDGGGTNFIKSYPATYDKPLLEIHWAKERSSKKLPAKGSEDKYQTDGLQVEGTREDGPRTVDAGGTL